MRTTTWYKTLTVLTALVTFAVLLVAGLTSPAGGVGTCTLTCPDSNRANEDAYGWMGGKYIYQHAVPSAVYGGGCSTGFPVEDSSQNWYLLTAYHCTLLRPRTDDGLWANDLTEIGPDGATDGAILDPHYDAALIPIALGDHQTWSDGGCYYGGCTNVRNVDGSVATADIGQHDVCMDGTSSLERCQDKMYGVGGVSFNGGPNLQVFDFYPDPAGPSGILGCQGGDSGGPVYYVPSGANAYAVGVIDATGTANGVNVCVVLDINTVLTRLKSLISPPTLLHVY